MSFEGERTEVSSRTARGWRLACILGLAAVFAGLALLFVLAPSIGAAIFGLPAPEGVAVGYVRAIGFRDAALALMLAGLGWRARQSAVVLVLRVSLVIPACDFVLVASSGPSNWPIALHLASGIVLLSLSFCLQRPAREPEPAPRPRG
jgi:hypothetical protein